MALSERLVNTYSVLERFSLLAQKEGFVTWYRCVALCFQVSSPAVRSFARARRHDWIPVGYIFLEECAKGKKLSLALLDPSILSISIDAM